MVIPTITQSSPNPGDPEALLNQDQAAAFLNVAPGSLEVWRSTGRVPLKYVKIGRAVRYRRADLEAFVAARTLGG